MKTNSYFGFGAVACALVLSFASCAKDDNPVAPESQPVTISFENAELNKSGFWCGDETGTPFDNWGSTGYACNYTEEGVNFPVNFTPAWASWSGFAISNRTETTYANITPDQFNNITGTAHSGENFCVVYPYGENIEFGGPVTLKGFWYTNNAWTVDAILNGDGMTPGKFDATDWFKCVIYPTPANGLVSGARYEIDLAKDGDYVKTWQFCDLSGIEAFKDITSISFAFESSRTNDWGVTTPTYMCIDDIVVVK